MAQDPSNFPKRSWREAAGRAEQPAHGKRRWQQTAPAPEKRTPVKSRGVQRKLAIGALAVLVGFLLWLFLWPKPPSPACLVLIGSGYEMNTAFPHNAAGKKGVDDLHHLARETGGITSILPWLSSKQLRLQFGPEEIKADTNWDEIFAKLFSRFNEKTVIVFLSLHGGADTEGPYLWADDPHAKKKIYLEKIIEKLNSPKLDGKNKVLILDTTQMVSHWASGMLHNDFSWHLKNGPLAEKIKKSPNLVVMCASDVDQRSWISPEWQQTIFTHYIMEGLQGAADTYQKGDSNNRVTAHELFHYVRDRVQAWVYSNRDAVQTPIMIGPEAEAKGMELVLIKEPYQEQSYSKAPGWNSEKRDSLNKDIQAALETWKSLKQSNPHPAIYSPHLWRHYQDTLVRYEQLLHLGDPTGKQKELKTRLTQLEGEINGSRILLPSPYSLGNSLAMPSVLGVSPSWPVDDVKGFLRDLEKAKDETERKKAWDGLQGWLGKQVTNLGSQHHQLLELQLSKLILNPLVKDNAIAKKWLDATELLKWINLKGKSLNLPPIEVHTPIMLLYEKIAPTPAAPASHLQLALKVRLMAENAALAISDKNAHPSSEIVWQWTRAKIKMTDDERRLGEDWLFSNTQDGWDNAEKYLKAAEEHYQEALQDALVVSEALLVRDQGWSVLPYYAQWVAGQWLHDQSPERKKLVQNWEKQVEDTARELDALVARLQVPNVKGEGLHVPLEKPKNLDPRSLKKLTADVKNALEGLQQEYDKECESLRDVQQQKRWHEIQSVLEVPLVSDIDLRLLLLNNSKSISTKLHESGIEKAEKKLPDPIQLDRLTKDRAQREGYMALAVAGEPWFGDSTREQVRKSIFEASPDGWRVTLTNAGKYLGAHYQKRLEIIEQGWSKSLEQADLDEALAALKDAEQFCRLVSTGDVYAQIPRDPFDPVQAARRLRFHNLMYWLAQRTQADHWYTDSELPGQTYYVPAAQNYLKDAQNLAVGKIETAALNLNRKTKAREFFDKLQPEGIAAVPLGSKQQHLTGEECDLIWTFELGENLPKGVPLIYLEAMGSKVDSKKKEYLERRSLTWPPQDEKYTFKDNYFDEKDPPLIPQSSDVDFVLKGVYRGQQILSPVTLQLHKTPEIIISRYPPPPEAKVAVYAEEEVPFGSLCIVLDFSGSMKDKIDKIAKIDHVRTAFEKVLGKIPADTQLSILVFGSEKKLFQWVRPPATWFATKREKEILIQDIGSLNPYGVTPIAEALLMAKNEGFPKNSDIKGPKIILALTDGEDTWFNNTNYTNGGTPPDAISKFMSKHFSNSEIEINMVCFTQIKGQASLARQQFEIIEKFEFPGTPGKFQQQPNPSELATTLEEALRPKLRLYENNKLLQAFKNGLIARPLTDTVKYNLEWETLKIDSPKGKQYQARLQNTFPQNLTLLPGELMLLNVTRGFGNNPIMLKRALFGELVERKKNPIDKTATLTTDKQWLSAILQNSIDSNQSRLTQLITLERAEQGDWLQHQYPGFVWLEVTDEDGKIPQGLRWNHDYGYPAPAVRLHAGKFHSNSKPKVAMWFLEGSAPGTLAKTFSMSSLKPKTVLNVLNTEVTVEKSGNQKRYVEVAPGKREIRDCYVVQLRYPPGQPIWVQAEKGAFQGEEHHYFTEIGRYEALFWGGPNPDEVHIISLQKLKKEVSPLNWNIRQLNPGDDGPSILEKKSPSQN